MGTLNNAQRRLDDLSGGDDGEVIINVYYGEFDGTNVTPPPPGDEPVSVISLRRRGKTQTIKVIKGIDLDNDI